MLKLVGLNYSLWKLKVRNTYWYAKIYGGWHSTTRPSLTTSMYRLIHLKLVTYIRCFIDMSLYNNCNEETNVEVLWKKIGSMFENKNVVNKFLVLRKIVRLRY